MRDGLPLVLFNAPGDGLAAAVEASLGDKPAVHIVVGRPRPLSQLVEEHDPVVLVLVSTATAGAASALQTLANIAHPPAVILLVDDVRATWRALARRPEVHAVLACDATPEQVAVAIRATIAGLVTLHPGALRPPVGTVVRDRTEEPVLTTREREILQMMAEGLSNRVIASHLGISPYTVKFHVASILGKLGARSRTEAVTLGVTRGLISV